MTEVARTLEDSEEIYIIPGTPSEVDPSVPSEYFTADLHVVETTEETLRYRDFDPLAPELHYDVFDYSGELIGDIGICYNYESKILHIANIIVLDKFRKRGYGKQLYELAATMTMPCGNTPDEAGFSFITEYPSEEAERVWKSLERKGLAIHMGKHAYWWVGQDNQ